MRGDSVSFVAAVLLSAAVASPVGVAPVAANAAAGAVDLTNCLAPGASTGDERVFRTSDGDDLRETVVQTDGWRRRRDGWKSITEAQLGGHEPTVRETYVKPGRAILLGDLAIGDLTLEMGEPSQWFPLAAVPGRTYTAELEGKALREGRRVGRARVSSAWQVIGFEPLTTAEQTYPDTVHIATARTVDVKQNDRGVRVRQESDVELWCVDGVGVVAATYAFRFYENGKLVREMDDFDSWLVSATVDGQSVD